MPKKNPRPAGPGGEASAGRFFRIAGHLALDFANTVQSIDQEGDAVSSWPDLVEVLAAVGIVNPHQSEALKRLEETAPQEADHTLHAGLRLRQAIREAAAAIANRQNIPERSAEGVNALLRLTEGYDQLTAVPGGWVLQFQQREKRLEWLLAAIARSAADLIVEGRRAPVRKCSDPKCVLYFYDTSRTGRRRWCSMALCGNRNKVAAFSRRKRKKKGARS